MATYFRGAIFVVSCLVLSTANAQSTEPAFAGDPSSLLGAASVARGGATVASPLTHDSLLQNPASSAFSNTYAVSGGYLGAGDALFASIVDTKSGPLGGGLYYLRRDLRTINEATADLGNFARYEEHAGLALMGKVQQNLALGATVRYAYRRSYDERVLNAANWNFDVGAQYLVNSQIMLGALAQNLMPNAKNLYPQRFGAGISYIAIPGLTLSTQVFQAQKPSEDSVFALPNGEKRLEYAIGAQFAPAPSVSLRAGFHENPAWRDRTAALGAAYLSKSFSVDYAFKFQTADFGANSHTVTLTGYF